MKFCIHIRYICTYYVCTICKLDCMPVNAQSTPPHYSGVMLDKSVVSSLILFTPCSAEQFLYWTISNRRRAKKQKKTSDHHSRGGPPCSRGRRMNRTSRSVLCACVCTSVYKANVSSYTCCSYMYICMYSVLYVLDLFSLPLQILKWSFSTPRSEFIEQLKDQMQPCVSRPLLTQLFHDDLKHHIATLGTHKEVCGVCSHCIECRIGHHIHTHTCTYIRTYTVSKPQTTC